MIVSMLIIAGGITVPPLYLPVVEVPSIPKDLVKR